MPSSAYQYTIDLLAEDGQLLGQVPAAPDWEPALEWAIFAGVRRRQLPAVTAAPTGEIEPIWHPQRGRPYVSGFRALIPADGSGTVSSDIPTAYFRTLARKASATLVEKGTLRDGEFFRYEVCAFPAPPGAPNPSRAGELSVEELPRPLALDETPLARFLGASVRSGEVAEDDPPVFVPQHVLDEAVALSRQAKDVETGGILVGKLHRDRDLPEVFLEVTAQIPAQHALSHATKLTFTPETWAAVAAALALRRRGEMMLGWWHFHPDFCRNCPLERRRQCRLSSPFLSAEDVHLHRACFGRAYQVALLVSDSTVTGLTWSLFGWRRGMVELRGFHMTGDPSNAG